jgi:predicted PurR-regulated permease PerM
MEDIGKESNVTRFLVTGACFVIIVAGMRTASSILVPLLLSLFIAQICTPFLFWMQRKRVPNALAVVVIFVAIVGIGWLLVAFVGSSLNSFSKALPLYQERLAAQTAALASWLSGLGMEVSYQVLLDYFDPRKAMSVVASTLTGLRAVLTNTFLILLTVVFILLEASGFPQKLRAALTDPDESLARLGKISASVNRYLLIKTLFSMFTGAAIWIWLLILGVDHPLLWGLLAFLLNFVPNIGSMIAAVPAVLLALIQLGTSSALLTLLGYVVVNVTIGSIIEPKFMGLGLGLSTLVVFLSLIFWGWVLGPVGMLLSVPLTMIVKIALESDDDTRWIGILLGSGPPPPTKTSSNAHNTER